MIRISTVAAFTCKVTKAEINKQKIRIERMETPLIPDGATDFWTGGHISNRD